MEKIFWKQIVKGLCSAHLERQASFDPCLVLDQGRSPTGEQTIGCLQLPKLRGAHSLCQATGVCTGLLG